MNTSSTTESSLSILLAPWNNRSMFLFVLDCLTNADCRQNNTICTAGNCTCADKAMHRDPPCTCKDGLVRGNDTKCKPGENVKHNE